jgi:hypothetical protein
MKETIKIYIVYVLWIDGKIVAQLSDSHHVGKEPTIDACMIN